MIVYCVWAWDQYYPEGCDRNLKGIYASREAALKLLKQVEEHCSYDYARITTDYVIGPEEEKE